MEKFSQSPKNAEKKGTIESSENVFGSISHEIYEQKIGRLRDNVKGLYAGLTFIDPNVKAQIDNYIKNQVAIERYIYENHNGDINS